ncbi:MAG: ribonuclease H-like domain-containing protein [Patescibacteria group bacterium]
MRKVVFDIETRNIFQDVGSRDPSLLDISLVGIYDSDSDSYRGFLLEELPELWPIIERADLLIGYNSEHFDLPLLNKYYHGTLSKIPHLDLLKEISEVLGRRISLNQIAEGTLGKKKLGNGLQAIEWWKKGDIESIRKYCLEDVKITKEIYEYALKNQKLKYKEAGKLMEIPLNTSGWDKKENNALTFSLPF